MEMRTYTQTLRNLSDRSTLRLVSASKLAIRSSFSHISRSLISWRGNSFSFAAFNTLPFVSTFDFKSMSVNWTKMQNYKVYTFICLNVLRNINNDTVYTCYPEIEWTRNKQSNLYLKTTHGKRTTCL